MFCQKRVYEVNKIKEEGDLSMGKMFFLMPLVMLVSGCATPVTMLENPTIGPVARCGGDRSGAIAGGLIGYSLQSEDAARCVQDYSMQGYRVMHTAPEKPTVK